MRVNSYGRKISLKEDIGDAILDGLPTAEEYTNFPESKAFDSLLSLILEVVQDHIEVAAKQLDSIIK